MSTENTIIEELKKGANLQFKFSLLNKLDDIILSIIKTLDESEKSKEEQKEGEAQSSSIQAQKHALSLASVLLKTKIDAKFNLSYIDDFDNNVKDWLGPSVASIIDLIPQEAYPPLKDFKELYDEISNKEDLNDISEVLVEFFHGVFNEIGVVNFIEEIMSYIHDNQDENDEADEDQDQEYSERMKTYLREIIKFLLDCFNERFQILFFFKTCFFNFDLKMNELRRTLYAFGKTVKKHQNDEEGDEDREEEA